jgi:hypothetical protein
MGSWLLWEPKLTLRRRTTHRDECIYFVVNGGCVGFVVIVEVDVKTN